MKCKGCWCAVQWWDLMMTMSESEGLVESEPRTCSPGSRAGRTTQ